MPSGKISFIIFVLFIVSQVYTIPVLTIGPSWAIWPTLTDVAVGMLAFWSLWMRGGRSREGSSVVKTGVVGFVGCAISYLLLNYLFGDYYLGKEVSGRAIGGYQLYRLVQALVVLAFATRVNFTSNQISMIRSTVLGIVIVVSVLIWGTYLGIITTGDLAPHISPNKVVSGPWGIYVGASNQGWGTIGYNHGYVAQHILVLTAIYLYLSKNYIMQVIVLSVGASAVFITESRAGFAGYLLFVIMTLSRNLSTAKIISLLVGLILVIAPLLILPLDDLIDLGDTASRQTTLAQGLDSEHLSGRDQIWSQRLSELDRDPIYWVFGLGFGNATATGSNAHMLYLHFVLEMGIVGLIIFLSALVMLLSMLMKHDVRGRPVTFMTIALLFMGITQESLYPVAAAGTFLSLFALAVGFALRPGNLDEIYYQIRGRIVIGSLV